MDTAIGSVESQVDSLDREIDENERSTAATRRQHYLDRLVAQAKAAADDSGLGLKPLRERALGLVGDRTFPHGRDEEWRFTDLSDLLAVPLVRAQPVDMAASDMAASDMAASAAKEAAFLDAEQRLATVNGYYSAALSATEKKIAGVAIAPLSELLKDPAYSQKVGEAIASKLAQAEGGAEVFTALNTAGFSDVMVVWVSADTVVDAPIYITRGSQVSDSQVSDSQASDSQNNAIAHLRMLVMADRHAKFTLVESFWGDDEQMRCNNSVTEIWLEEGAQVEHVRLQDEGDETFHIAKTAISQAQNSHYCCTAVDLGARLSRHHLEVYQLGPQTETYLYGLSALNRRQLADTHSLVKLRHPHGGAAQIQKNIIDDRAHAVFNGKLYVTKEAQLTNASQLNRNLLLSDGGRVDTKPELDIVADNVKCAHGATVSQLQADELFYLQSRGISADRAKWLLLYGFAMEIVEKISVAPVKQLLSDRITSWTR